MPSARRSEETTSPGCKSRIASSARCRWPASRTGRSPTLTSSGPRIRNSFSGGSMASPVADASLERGKSETRVALEHRHIGPADTSHRLGFGENVVRKLALTITTLIAIATAAAIAAAPASARHRPLIAEFALPPGVAPPFGIAGGAGGAMCFSAGDFIGRISYDGDVVTSQVPTANAPLGVGTR